jgi:tRNA-intron endonuclease
MIKQKIQTYVFKSEITSNNKKAQELNEKRNFGQKIGEKVKYSPSEALYLFEEEKLEIFQGNKKLTKKEIIKKLQNIDKKFQIKYPVFKDLRSKGYVVKTALKFGAEFRIYPKGKNPKNSHAKWIVFTDKETGKLNWYDFSAKNRVAHSTKKKLLLAIVDQEENVLYYEINWLKP